MASLGRSFVLDARRTTSCKPTEQHVLQDPIAKPMDFSSSVPAAGDAGGNERCQASPNESEGTVCSEFAGDISVIKVNPRQYWMLL